MRNPQKWFHRYTRRSQFAGQCASLCALIYFIWHDAARGYAPSAQQRAESFLQWVMLLAMLSAVVCLGSALVAWFAKRREETTHVA